MYTESNKGIIPITNITYYYSGGEELTYYTPDLIMDMHTHILDGYNLNINSSANSHVYVIMGMKMSRNSKSYLHLGSAGKLNV